MNDEEFEDKLRALTTKVTRPDPTPAWKADILAQARRARAKGAPHAPRWLLTVLGAAWLLIAALRFSTPADSSVRGASPSSTVAASQRETSMRWLMAYHSNPDLLDLP